MMMGDVGGGGVMVDDDGLRVFSSFFPLQNFILKQQNQQTQQPSPTDLPALTQPHQPHHLNSTTHP
jgi:hypothetical protein